MYIFISVMSLIFFSLSCGRQDDSQGAVLSMVTDSDLVEIIKSFKKDAEIREISVNEGIVSRTKFGLLGPNIKGVCSSKLNNNNELEYYVLIKKEQTYESAKITIYHEYGHCMYGLSHTKNEDDIMYSAAVDENVIRRWPDAVENLFDSVDNQYKK